MFLLLGRLVPFRITVTAFLQSVLIAQLCDPCTRRWIQAVFSNKPTEQNNEPIIHSYSNNYGNAEVDISGSVADLFCLSSSADEVILNTLVDLETRET